MNGLLFPCRYGASPLWDRLIAWVEALVAAASPAGSGQHPVTPGLRRHVRHALRKAEALLRWLLWVEAEALMPQLPPSRTGSRAATPAVEARDRTGSGLVFCVGGSAMFGRQGPATGAWPMPAGTRAIDNPFDIPLVSIWRECQRLAALAATVQAPGRAIRRLAFLRRRRSASSDRTLSVPLPLRPFAVPMAPAPDDDLRSRHPGRAIEPEPPPVHA